jgi:hypothetical protein
MVVGAEAGKGYIVFNSLQVIQALANTGNQELVEVMENFLFWRGPLSVDAQSKLATTWGMLKNQ